MLQHALARNGLAKPFFLLLRQVSLNDLELLTLDSLSNPVHHGSTRQQEQGRGAWGDLFAHLFDKVLINAIIGKVSDERPHCGPYRQAEERDKEQQSKQQPPEGPTQCTSPSRAVELYGFGFTGSFRQGTI